VNATVADVRGYYAALGVDLPDRAGNVTVRCFTGDHDDRRASGSVNTDSGLWHCHSCGEGGNAYQAALKVGLSKAEALELTARHGLREPGAGNGHREIVATYPYEDEDGELLFEVARFEPKDFRQRRPDGHGGWDWKLGNTPRVLYRLPRVSAAAEAGELVFVVEGEKDVHALERLGLTATCNAMGAGKWRAEYSRSLRGARVVVVPDCDQPGREHALKAARALDGAGCDARILDLAPERDDGHDVADWLADASSEAERTEARELLLSEAENAPHADEFERDCRGPGPTGAGNGASAAGSEAGANGKARRGNGAGAKPEDYPVTFSDDKTPKLVVPARCSPRPGCGSAKRSRCSGGTWRSTGRGRT
jgi:5S rRNA maturation endonuclease (ribonuclease M5)